MEKVKGIIKELFTDIDKAGEELQQAKEKLDNKAKELEDAKEVFLSEYEDAVYLINTPLEEAQYAREQIEEEQDRLEQSDDFSDIAEGQETIEDLERAIKAQERLHENRLEEDKPEMLQAYAELLEAEKSLNNQLRAFSDTVQRYKNKDNASKLQAVKRDYKAMLPNNRQIGVQLNELGMLEPEKLGTKQLSVIYLPNGRKKSFRNV